MIRSREFIDVYVTTYRRPQLLEVCLKSIFEAIAASDFQHRVTILSDHTDRETLDVLLPYLSKVFLVSTSEQLGLPFTFNMIHDFSNNLSARTGKHPKLICYLQDDTIIDHPNHYFSTIMDVSKMLPKQQQGFVSGFYTPLHPGFEKIDRGGVTILKSETFDGKNIVGSPQLFESIGKLSWKSWGLKRGNPGKYLGSGFDLWQWRDSPNSTQKQGRINLIVPGLISHTGSEESTWGNTSDTVEKTEERIEKGRIYASSKEYPKLNQSDFFKG